MIFGEPEQWLALLIESLLVAGHGALERSEELRSRAFDAAPASAGVLDGTAFEWIADADMRLGPVCEAIINGRYYLIRRAGSPESTWRRPSICATWSGRRRTSSSITVARRSG